MLCVGLNAFEPSGFPLVEDLADCAPLLYVLAGVCEPLREVVQGCQRWKLASLEYGRDMRTCDDGVMDIVLGRAA